MAEYYTVYTDDSDYSFRVKGSYRPGRPGVFSGPPDCWCPDDPDDFDVEDIIMFKGNEGVGSIYAFPEGMVNDGFLDKIIEKAWEQAAVEYQDNRYDPREDYQDDF